MTAATGTAMRMKFEIAALRKRHRLPAQDPVRLALSPPAGDRPTILEGFASTTSIDLDRQRFGRRALTWGFFPPLLLKHDPAQVAGEILSLDYDGSGNLKIRARVDLPEAIRMPAFSVAGIVKSYTLVDVDHPDRFCAEIRSAEITEISLTSTPSNPAAIVIDRYRALAPAVEFHDLMLRKVGVLQDLTRMIREITARPRPRLRDVRPPPPFYRPRSAFGLLVDEINR